VVHTGPFRFDDGEVVEATWLTLDELLVAIGGGRYLPDSVALLVPLLTAE
jgi:hypothetical protein